MFSWRKCEPAPIDNVVDEVVEVLGAGVVVLVWSVHLKRILWLRVREDFSHELQLYYLTAI